MIIEIDRRSLTGWLLAAAALLIILGGMMIRVTGSQTPALTPEPTRTPAPTPVSVEPGVREAIQSAKAFKAQSPYSVNNGTGSVVISTLVSSGEFGTVEVPWQTKTVLADVVWAYDWVNPGLVVKIPIVVGLLFPDGYYAYFSHYSIYPLLSSGTTPSVSRTEAVADMRTRLPRGRVFSVVVSEMVNDRELVWEQCPAYLQSWWNTSPAVCEVGAWVDRQYPGTTTQFMRRVESSVPAGYFLVGWFFQEMSPETANIWEIQLPAPQNTP